MPKVFITCSLTNSPVWTGVEADSRRELETTEGPVRNFACPACILVHDWQIDDAYLDGEAMKAPPGQMDRADDRPDEEAGGELAGSR